MVDRRGARARHHLARPTARARLTRTLTHAAARWSTTSRAGCTSTGTTRPPASRSCIWPEDGTPRRAVRVQRRQRLARRRPARRKNAGRATAGPLAAELFDRMRWDAFYDPGDERRRPPDVRPGGLMHGGFYPFADGRPGGTYRRHPHRRRPGLAHHAPLRHDRLRDADHELPRHPHRPGARRSHYYAPWRTFPATCDWSWHEMQPVGETRTYLGIDVYEGAYTYRGMHIVPGWGGSMFEELMPAVFVPEEEWAPRSWGVNHPLHVRAEREHGLVEADYGYWGFSPVEQPGRRLPRVRRRRARAEPRGLLLRPGEDQLDVGFGDCRDGDQPEPRLTGRRRHAARLVPRDDVRARRGHGQPASDPEQARRLRRAVASSTPWPIDGTIARRYLSLDQAMVMGALGNVLGKGAAAQGVQHPRRREGAAPRHRHRGVRRRHRRRVSRPR